MVAYTAAAPTFLREFELRLLRCTLPSPSSPPPPRSPAPPHPLGPVAASALAAVEAGDYAAALASTAPHLLPASAFTASPDCAAQFYADLAAAAEAFLRGDGEGAAAAGEVFECRCAVVLSAAVAALLAFTQQNVTGPSGKFSPFPFWTSSLDEGWYGNLGGKWDAWASDHLTSFGSHVHGKFSLLQVDAKSQMVLVAKTSNPAADEGQATEVTGAQNDVAALKNARSSVPSESDEFCDILRMPRLVQNGNALSSESTTDPSTKISLTAIQQAAVLAQFLHVSRRSRSDEMSGWEMAPYIESIDSQDESYFVVRSLCDILRIRWESTRSHTKQRALLMMENLVEDVGKEFPVAAQRAKLVFGVHMPTLPALRKEYGELLISCGIVGEALDIFIDCELWDNLIYCYR